MEKEIIMEEVFMPLIGETVPEEFTFEAYHGGNIVDYSFKGLRGKWVILMFYPADFTFVCPTELEDMQEQYAAFKEAGAEVISMSTDTVFSHKAWKDISPSIKNIEFPMGADSCHELSEAFDVLIPEKGIANRGTFIIDPNGVIKGIEITHDSIGRSAAETLRKLKAAIYTENNPGNVCPANFTDGDKTLQPSIELAGKI